MLTVAWFRRHERQLLIILVLLTITLRLYRITNPLLDWHAWRQADTAAVTREYVRNGVDLLHPRFMDISSTPSGRDNPDGYRMVEFPILNAFTALIMKVIPGAELQITSRLVSVLCSTIAALSLYGLVRSLSGKKVAVLSTLAFAVMPFSIFYGRTVLPEPALLAMILSSLYALRRWSLHGDWKWFAVSFASLVLAYLLKPYAIFFAPVFIALAWIRWQWRAVLKWQLWLLAILPLAPLAWWRTWIQNYPEGIPGSDWLFNSNGIRFKTSWLRWLFFERLTRLIVGSAGVSLLLGNILGTLRTDLIVYGAWWAGMIVYLSVLATGNVQHDYYQSLLIPIVAISLGRGGVSIYTFLAEKARISIISKAVLSLCTIVVGLYASTFLFGAQASGYFPEILSFDIAFMLLSLSCTTALAWWRRREVLFPKKVVIGLLIAVSILSWSRSWQYVSGYFNVNHWEFVRAGQAAQRLTPDDALIIAPHFGDTQLLFQTNRSGWPIGGSIDEKIRSGADYYLATAQDDEATMIKARFTVLEQTDEYALYDLNKPL